MDDIGSETLSNEAFCQLSSKKLTYRSDPFVPLGHLSKETVYERAKYFLERVIPTAEEYNVQMACHLEDPPAPVLRGIEMWNYPVLEGCERFANLVVRNPLTERRRLETWAGVRLDLI